MTSTFEIAGRPVGRGRCFVIAEAGVNHNGDVAIAERLIAAAAEAGADAVKFQTFSADRLVTPGARKAAYQATNTGSGGSQYEMLKALELSTEAHLRLKQCAEAAGLVFLSTPFDEESARDLAAIDMAAFKVGSGDLTNRGLLLAVAGFGKPVLLSTGMATQQEVDEAVALLRGASSNPIAVLQCTSAYPAPAESINLRVMSTYRQRYGVAVGFSDHTLGASVPLAAVALGADLIEKHLTLDRSMEGPDHRASLEPTDFAKLVSGIREIEVALGSEIKQPEAVEQDAREVARRSLFARVPIKAGDVFTAEHLVALRPATGLSPMSMPEVIGRRAARDLDEYSPVTDRDVC